MPYKRTFTTKVIELLVLGKIKPHILNKKIASEKEPKLSTKTKGNTN